MYVTAFCPNFGPSYSLTLKIKGLIKWIISAQAEISPRAEISARLTGLKFQPGFWKKSSWNQIVDYMERNSARAEKLSCNRKEISVRAEKQERAEVCHVRESSFYMTRGGGGGGDEDIEWGLWNFLDTRKGHSEKIRGVSENFVCFKTNRRGRGS